MTGRYYQDPSLNGKGSVQGKAGAKLPTADAEPEHEQLLAALKQKVAEQPDNEELWVLYALQHVNFGAVQSLKGMCVTNAHSSAGACMLLSFAGPCNFRNMLSWHSS